MIPDEDYLLELALTEQAAAELASYEDRCATGCRHSWHGVECSTRGCGCPSSYRATA